MNIELDSYISHDELKYIVYTVRMNRGYEQSRILALHSPIGLA